MLIFNKLLPVFVLPLGWVFILLAIAVVRRKRWPCVAAMVLLHFSSIEATSRMVLGGLESRSQPIGVDEALSVDAIVVLSGSFGPPVAAGQIANLSESCERLEAGIQLAQRQRGEWLVFTGGRLPWDADAEVEGERSKRLAVSRGISPEKILVTGAVGNTADEAVAVAELCRQRKWSRVLLVTTAWHMPRASRLFRAAGVTFLPFPVDYWFGHSSSLHLLDFVPSAGALRATEIGLREVYGLAFYALTGR